MVVYILFLKFALLVIPIFRTFISDDSRQVEKNKEKDMTVKLGSSEEKKWYPEFHPVAMCILNSNWN